MLANELKLWFPIHFLCSETDFGDFVNEAARLKLSKEKSCTNIEWVFHWSSRSNNLCCVAFPSAWWFLLRFHFSPEANFNHFTKNLLFNAMYQLFLCIYFSFFCVNLNTKQCVNSKQKNWFFVQYHLKLKVFIFLWFFEDGTVLNFWRILRGGCPYSISSWYLIRCISLNVRPTATPCRRMIR